MTDPEQKVVDAARAVLAWDDAHEDYLDRLTFADKGQMEALIVAVREYNAEQVAPSGEGLRVTAETHDDEHYHEVPEFDCTPYFEQAADEDLVQLADCGFGGDYPADWVAEYFEDNNHYPEIVAMFQYKRTGFECHVNEEEAVAWLRAYRPHLVHRSEAYPNDEDAYEIHLPGRTVT